MRRIRAASLVLVVAWFAHAPLARTDAPPVAPLPERLEDTGLYSDWTTKTVDPANLPYAPQYPLWTDGAAKSRWLHLPPGTWIDASDPDAWVFPVGTKAWKEFRFNGAPAETRFIERTRDGWRYAAYVWRPDGTAPLAPARGILNSVDIADGVRHAIPSRTDCTACHEAGPSRLLSVGALQLSTDRDPLAPHAEPVPQGGLTLESAVARQLVRNLPDRIAASAPRIDAATPVERAALGYLHGNCGMCHTAAGEMASIGLALQYTLASAPGVRAPAIRTGLAQPSHFSSANHPTVRQRIAPGHPDASMLVVRMASRHPVLQMPPLGTRVIDTEAVALIREWIAATTREGMLSQSSMQQEGPHAQHPHP